jgi:hypothetical protein
VGLGVSTDHKHTYRNSMRHFNVLIGGLVVSVLATEPTGYSVVGSNPVDFYG